MLKKILLLSILITSLFISISVAIAGKNSPRAYEDTRQINKKTHCVYDETSGKWKAATKKGELFKLKKKPKKGSKNFEKKSKKFKKDKRTCKKQSAPDAVDFDSIPSASDILGSSQSSEAVSGTAPTIGEITNTSALTTYWREVGGENVIAALQSGTPTTAQCNEFYGGANDGESGGLVACEANVDALRALVKPIEANISTCYLKELATEEAVESGAVSLVGKSKFPNANIANLYAPPSGTGSRIVEMRIVNGDQTQTIFVGVPGAKANEEANKKYSVNLWFCDSESEDGTPSGLDQISVGADNSYSASSVGLRDGQNSVTLTGSVTVEDDDYVFDPSQPTRGVITFIGSEEDEEEGEEEQEEESTTPSFVASYDITVQDGIITLLKHLIENDEVQEVTKGIAKLSFAGGISDLQMFEGAGSFQTFNGDTLTDDETTAFEFRDTQYLVTDESDLLSEVAEEDYSGEFFTTTPSISLDTTGFSCNDTADVVVEIDMTSEFMSNVQTACESFIPQNTRFCESEAIDEAEESFETNCS